MVWGEVPEAYAVLSRHLDEPLERLAPGLRRLARLTVHRSLGAPLILLDEPEVGLDTQESDWLAQLCLSARRSVSLIVVTHHLGFARTIADYAVLVVDGCLIEAAPAHQFFSSPKHPRTRSYLHSGS
jgi:ABC-type phosphate transport system ATPase subunit